MLNLLRNLVRYCFYFKRYLLKCLIIFVYFSVRILKYLMVFVLLGVLLVFEKVSVIKIEKDSVIIEWIKLVLDGGFRIRKYIIYKRIEMIDKWIKVILVE